VRRKTATTGIPGIPGPASIPAPAPAAAEPASPATGSGLAGRWWPRRRREPAASPRRDHGTGNGSPGNGPDRSDPGRSGTTLGGTRFDDMGRYGHGHCTDCGTDNTGWYTDTSLWHEVMGRSPVFGEPGEGICLTCFTARAAAVGIVPAAWNLSAQWRPSPCCVSDTDKPYTPRHSAH